MEKFVKLEHFYLMRVEDRRTHFCGIFLCIFWV